MILLHIVTIFLMILKSCDALGNTATFTGKIRLIAAENSNVNIPCTFSRSQSDMVTLILFYRNASQVGHIAPLYTLDARMMYDQKTSTTTNDTKLMNIDKNDQKHEFNKFNNEKMIRRQSIDYLLNDLHYKNLINAINYHHLVKRSLLIAKNQSKYSNENQQQRLTSSIGNVSMVNGISSLMHLLAIKGHLNQSRLNVIGEKEKINPIDNLSNQTIINIEKKSGINTEEIEEDVNSSGLHSSRLESNYRSFFYQLQNDKQDWPQNAESSLLESKNQFNNLFDQKNEANRDESPSKDENADRNKQLNDEIEANSTLKMLKPNPSRSTSEQLENQPQHFVAPSLANRLFLTWPPTQLRHYQPYNSLANSDKSNSPSSISSIGSNRPNKLESRSQTVDTIRNHTKNEPLLYFNALLNIRNATEEDAGEYLCRVDLRFGRTIIQHIVLEIVSSPKTVIILDSSSQVVHDWTNVYLENTKTQFNCEIDGGRPQTPIQWLLNGELLNPTWSSSIKLQNSAVTRSQLQIQMTRELFNGSLTCRVQNQFYTMSSTVKIDLILKPQRLTIRPSVSPLVVDNQVDLVVQTHGSFPPSDLICFLHNQTLNGEIKKANSLKLFSTTTLIIKYIPQRYDHNEEIICKAINHAFPANESIELRYKLDVHYKPILKLQFQNSNPNRLIKGSSLMLNCQIDSNPPYKEIQWFKNGLLFAALNNFIQTELRVDNTSLVTNSLSKLDSGRYTCSSRNQVGTTDSESITIDVLHAPECSTQNQKFIYGIELGETTVIDCALVANPSEKLTFHWRYHDSSGEVIDLATISTQIDDSFKKSSNGPSYSALIKNNGSANDEPITSRYLSFLDKSEPYLSSSFSNNKPLMYNNNKNSERSNLLQQIFISSNGTSSSLHYTMKYPKKVSGSFIECWASNSIGVQKEPCMYSLVTLDVPDQVENCTISAPINNFHLLECSPGKNDGGVHPQAFHCEIYVQLDKRKEDDQQSSSSSEQSTQSTDQFNLHNFNQMNQQDNQFNFNDFNRLNQKKGSQVKNNLEVNQDSQYDDYPNSYRTSTTSDQTKASSSNQLILIANYTEYSYPTFVLSLVNMNISKLNLNKLSSIDTLHLVVYSSNPKGSSNKISLDFNIGNQTNQLKNLFAQQTNGQEGKFNILNEWSLILTATLSTLTVWFLCAVIYLVISNRVKKIKMTRRYINNCKKQNAIKVNQNSLVPINHQAIVPFDESNLQSCNVIGSDCHDSSVYGCNSSMIINHFEQNSYKAPICLSSAELLKLKIKQLD